MKMKTFSKFAAVSAVALMSVMHANNVFSAAYTIGTDVGVNFDATVVSDIDVAVTDGDFGTIAAMNSSAVGDTATTTLPAAAGAQVLVDDHSTGMGTATQASITGDDAAGGTAAVVDVTLGFENETMFVTFGTCVDLTAGAGPELLITAVTTDLPGATPYDCVTPMAAGDTLTLDAAGAGSFHVGASISTDGTTNAAYPAGAYAGSVQMQITY